MSAWIAVLVLPLIACIGVIAWLRRSRVSERLSDLPNQRSLHSSPTPRIGGIGLIAASLPLAVTFSSPDLYPVWAAATGLALLSLADDVRSLPIIVRLPAHFAAAAIATIAIATVSEQNFVLVAAVIVAIAWMTNLYNFMDGADGLAGGMALIGFGAYAVAAHDSGATSLALGCAAISAAAAGFLAFNFPPARLFMGDAGSIPLGFLAGALGAAGVAAGAWPPWFPFLVFSPFIVDASVTLARRLLRGEPVWIAHRSHYYQRLVISGWSTRRLASWSYVVMAAAAISALVGRAEGASNQCAILVVWSVLYLAAIGVIERRSPLESAS